MGYQRVAMIDQFFKATLSGQGRLVEEARCSKAVNLRRENNQRHAGMQDQHQQACASRRDSRVLSVLLDTDRHLVTQGLQLG
jgi:hypothetical protein